MKTTLTVIKADIGAVGGHTQPSAEVINAVKAHIEKERSKLFIDAYYSHTGDDIAALISHTNGVKHSGIHQLVWEALKAGTEVAKKQGLYGAGQDLLKDAFAGNVSGLGPAHAEMEFEERPNEAFIFFAADKTEPGAYNLPFYLAFADPMYSPGLLLSEELHQGFHFVIMDVDHTEGDRIIELDAPENLYDIASLLRDTHRYVIESIWSRKYPDSQAAAVSTTRLRNIAGKYVGKDDPVAIVRVQKTFPATEEFGPPFAMGQFVAGDTRGSHNLPLMPVPTNTPASTFFCCPEISALAFSMRDGIFTTPVDLFAEPFWQQVRARVVDKAIDMRRQGFFGPAMLGMDELEYGGIVKRLERLEKQFKIRQQSHE